MVQAKYLMDSILKIMINRIVYFLLLYTLRNAGNSATRNVVIVRLCNHFEYSTKVHADSFFAPSWEFLWSVLRISLLRPKKFSAPSIIWISKGTDCRGRYCRPSRLHLQPPRGNTCRLPEVTRADSGLSKMGCERWGIKYIKVPLKRLAAPI